MIIENVDLKAALDAAFKPRSIAVIGASNRDGLGKADMRILLETGYQGEIYPVNPREEVIQGIKAFPSVLDIPGPVDRAAVIVPAKFVPQVIRECAQKGVRVVQIYSAGFGEYGEKGKDIERQLVSISRKHGMRIIGPNCIGTYCPESRVNFTLGASGIPGKIAFVSQSGGIAFDIVTRGSVMGLHFSKVISVGNCIDLDHPDYLEYLAEDEATEAIGFYIESVKDGGRFLKLLKEVTKTKPVVILKGGRTEIGTKSVASHTGNLAGDYAIWQALFRQTNVLPVKSIEEMLVTLLSIQNIRPMDAKGVAIVGNGGGASVLATDYCDELKLNLGNLNPRTVQKLNQLGVAEGKRNINPIDMPAGQLTSEEGKLFGDVLKILSEDPSIGYILFHLNLIPISNYMNLKYILNKMFGELERIDCSKSSLIGVLRYNGLPEIEQIRYDAAKLLEKKGIPVFSSIEQGLDAIRIAANWCRQ